jgi:tetratricopeptide (TPR) repeat protein
LTQLRQAQEALMRRDYLSARRGFESVLMHDSNLESAQKGLRRTLIALGEFNKAERFMSDTTSPDGVIIQVRLGQISDPEQLISDTLKHTSDPRLWTLLGQLQDKDGKFLLARQSYAMANLAGARPGLSENNIGQSHWLAGEPELALEAFTRAAELDPYDIQFDNNRRRALIHLGHTQDAIAGLDASRAGLFLAQAADKAAQENETKLAKFLYRKSLNIAPRHNPRIAEKLARLEQ